MSKTPRRGNPLALAVLSCLFERPMHPYEIATTLRQRAKHESIKLNYGSLYNVVESLVRDGLIEPTETSREGRRPERTVYRLLDPGRVLFVDWLSELLSTPSKEFTRFEAGLSLMPGLSPDDVITLLETRAGQLTIAIGGRRAQLQTAREAGVPDLFLIEDEYRLVLQEAELAFTRRLAADIAAGALAGVEWWREAHEETARAHEEGREPQVRPPM
jgi:DNA-binding PadR family transcriptional regulator